MSSARTFDIEIVTKEGPEHTFTSINKEEHEGVESYLKSKKVRVKNQMNEDLGAPALGDDDDDEMQSVASSGEEVTKPRAAIDDEDSEDGMHSDYNHVLLLTLVCSLFRRRFSSFIQ